MKKVIYVLILPVMAAGGLVFANRDSINGTTAQLPPKPLSAAEREAAVKQWEATPGGILYKQWETSPEGKKILAGAADIRSEVKASAPMEAVVTSLSLPPGSRLGFGVMVRIDGGDYILVFEPEKSQLPPLRSLKVNDKITIKSHSVSWAPKYAYPIVWGDYVERDGNILYKHIPRKGGC